MLFIRLLRFIFGYVAFEGTGVFCESFLNSLRINDIPIWNSKKRGLTLTGFVRAKDYSILRPYVKKSGLKIHITKKIGLPFFVKKQKKRIGFFCGIFAFLVIISLSGNMVWQINVNGNEKVATEKIISVLEELGIKKGFLPGSENYYFVEQEAILKIPELSWLAINRSGSVVTVDVKETYTTPKVVDLKSPCDIVAKKDGFIIKNNAYKGIAIVKKGSGVLEGDVLVSGTVTDKNGGVSRVHSVAEIVAETENYLAVNVDRNEEILTLSGNKRHKRTLIFLGMELPLFFDNHPYEFSQITHSDSTIKIGAEKIGLKENIYAEKIKSNANYTDDEMKKIAYARMEELVHIHYQNDSVEILNIYYDESFHENTFTLSALIKCHENVALEKPI